MLPLLIIFLIAVCVIDFFWKYWKTFLKSRPKKQGGKVVKFNEDSVQDETENFYNN